MGFFKKLFGGEDVDFNQLNDTRKAYNDYLDKIKQEALRMWKDVFAPFNATYVRVFGEQEEQAFKAQETTWPEFSSRVNEILNNILDRVDALEAENTELKARLNESNLQHVEPVVDVSAPTVDGTVETPKKKPAKKSTKKVNPFEDGGKNDPLVQTVKEVVGKK